MQAAIAYFSCCEWGSW